MNHHDWAITACLQFADGELIDKKRPFGVYHVEASSADDAIKKLKSSFSMCKITIHGNPKHTIVSEKEYEATIA